MACFAGAAILGSPGYAAAYSGLLGFNSLLSCAGLGGFFWVLSVRSFVTAVLCALFTVTLQILFASSLDTVTDDISTYLHLRFVRPSLRYTFTSLHINSVPRSITNPTEEKNSTYARFALSKSKLAFNLKCMTSFSLKASVVDFLPSNCFYAVHLASFVLCVALMVILISFVLTILFVDAQNKFYRNIVIVL